MVDSRVRCCQVSQAHPEERVQCSVLHELGDDEHRAATGQHTLQVDYVGVVELSHDARLGQEVPALALGVACLQRLDGHGCLLAARLLQATPAHLAELPCGKVGGRREW